MGRAESDSQLDLLSIRIRGAIRGGLIRTISRTLLILVHAGLPMAHCVTGRYMRCLLERHSCLTGLSTTTTTCSRFSAAPEPRGTTLTSRTVAVPKFAQSEDVRYQSSVATPSSHSGSGDRGLLQRSELEFRVSEFCPDTHHGIWKRRL